MKDLLMALWLSAVVMIVLIYGVFDYAEVHTLKRDGVYGEVAVGSLAEERKGKNSTTYFYEAELAGEKIRMRSSERRDEGQRITVLFDAAALRRYRHEYPKPFTTYRIAWRSDSTLWLFRETIVMVLLTVTIAGWGAWYHWWKVIQAERKESRRLRSRGAAR